MTGGPTVSAAKRSSANPGLTSFVQALSRANSGLGYWEPGWAVTEHRVAESVVRKDGITVTARNDRDVRFADTDSNGTLAQVHFPNALFGMSPGFYMAVGNQALPRGGSDRLFRLYWNATPECAIELIPEFSKEFNAARVPYIVKAINDPEGYHRCDAVVLYCLIAHYAEVASILEHIHSRISRLLKAKVPAFTKQIAFGFRCRFGGGRRFTREFRNGSLQDCCGGDG
jgi:hypothetical protein